MPPVQVQAPSYENVKVKNNSSTGQEEDLSAEEQRAMQEQILNDLFNKCVSNVSGCWRLNTDAELHRIRYSDNYEDDMYTYRHVTLPKPLLKIIPKEFWNKDGSGTLKLLTEDECRIIGISQSLGWEHYEIHGT
jgi:hypothetical protein